MIQTKGPEAAFALAVANQQVVPKSLGRGREGCFKAFRLNHWLGFTVFAGVVAGYAIK